jgi:hypothetical protein
VYDGSAIIHSRFPLAYSICSAAGEEQWDRLREVVITASVLVRAQVYMLMAAYVYLPVDPARLDARVS